MANKQKHNYSLGYNTWDQIKALAGSAKGRNLFLKYNLLYCICLYLLKLLYNTQPQRLLLDLKAHITTSIKILLGIDENSIRNVTRKLISCLGYQKRRKNIQLHF